MSDLQHYDAARPLRAAFIAAADRRAANAANYVGTEIERDAQLRAWIFRGVAIFWLGVAIATFALPDLMAWWQGAAPITLLVRP